MCEHVVVPNMLLLESDEEAFEDNPEDYMRKDIEGCSTSTST